jgi:hypothetical protein
MFGQLGVLVFKHSWPALWICVCSKKKRLLAHLLFSKPIFCPMHVLHKHVWPYACVLLLIYVSPTGMMFNHCCFRNVYMFGPVNMLCFKHSCWCFYPMCVY